MLYTYIHFAMIEYGNPEMHTKMQSGYKFEPLMTEVTRFLGTEHTCKRISLLTEVSLVY